MELEVSKQKRTDIWSLGQLQATNSSDLFVEI